jgi:hypothetical protein
MVHLDYKNNSYEVYFINVKIVIKCDVISVVGQERKPMSERKCEGMNFHILKGAFTLGIEVSVDSQMFRE